MSVVYIFGEGHIPVLRFCFVVFVLVKNGSLFTLRASPIIPPWLLPQHSSQLENICLGKGEVSFTLLPSVC